MQTTLAAAVILTVLVSASFLPAASAHPYIEETIPSTSQNAPIGTTEVIISFSESIDIDFSEISVLNDKGERIDNRDVAYHHKDLALVVTTPPLESGVYTVSTKVLSKVDGHLVPGVFLFGVGDVMIDPKQRLDIKESAELIFLPEATAKFLGSMGQTIIVGAVVTAFAVWGTQNKQYIKEALGRVEKIHHRRLVQLTGAGLLLVLSSVVAVMVTQMIRLEASLGDIIQTQFGVIWLARIALTIVLFVTWFVMNRYGTAPSKMLVMLGAALVMMMTHSISGHGAATEMVSAVALDYAHNVVAGIWIGGIIYILFGLIPTLSGCPEEKRERMCLALIPKFSMIFIISVGVVIVTGPTLLWMLESDTGLITESLFGKLIILKIAIASVMVGLGALIQYNVQRKAEREIYTSRKISIYNKLKKTLKIDVALGILLLVVVALLTNGTLPAGEIKSIDSYEEFSGLRLTEFSENAKFKIEITPFSTGENLITVLASQTDGAKLYDLDRIKVKLSNPAAGVPPIEVVMEPVQRTDSRDDAVRFQGEGIFGFAGQWLVEVEAQRTENANEAVRLNLFAKPRLADISATITEYPLPNGTRPLHAAYDGSDAVWFSDAAAARLWEISTDTKEIKQHTFEGASTTFLTYNHRDWNVWFTDSKGGQIGFIDTQNGRITTIPVPEFDSVTNTSEKPIPFFIESDKDGDVWFTIINKGLIVRYQPQMGTFDEIVVPGDNPRPFALEEGPDGMMWYTATGTGVVGYVDPDSGSITDVLGLDEPLSGPEALLFERDASDGVDSLWISEHTGTAVIRFDPFLETLDRYMVPDVNALPFGMALDRYGNLWFAEHTTDKIGVIDPNSVEVVEIDIPTQTSFVQFLVSDDDGNLWFAEQRASKIGMLSTTENPSTYQATETGGTNTDATLESIRYADLASPLIALGILATSLFYVKAVHDKRRLSRLLTSD